METSLFEHNRIKRNDSNSWKEKEVTKKTEGLLFT